LRELIKFVVLEGMGLSIFNMMYHIGLNYTKNNGADETLLFLA
jgi:hypothetical protein